MLMGIYLSIWFFIFFSSIFYSWSKNLKWFSLGMPNILSGCPQQQNKQIKYSLFWLFKYFPSKYSQFLANLIWHGLTSLQQPTWHQMTLPFKKKTFEPTPWIIKNICTFLWQKLLLETQEKSISQIIFFSFTTL